MWGFLFFWGDETKEVVLVRFCSRIWAALLVGEKEEAA